jgi:hypothetical protein
MLSEVQGGVREITGKCRKPLDRFLDEVQLPAPDRLDPVQRKPIRPHHCIDVLVVNRKYRLGIRSAERQPLIRIVWYRKLVPLGASVCHIFSQRKILARNGRKRTAKIGSRGPYSITNLFIFGAPSSFKNAATLLPHFRPHVPF